MRGTYQSKLWKHNRPAPQNRWENLFVKVFCVDWIVFAQDRNQWKGFEENVLRHARSSSSTKPQTRNSIKKRNLSSQLAINLQGMINRIQARRRPHLPTSAHHCANDVVTEVAPIQQIARRLRSGYRPDIQLRITGDNSFVVQLCSGSARVRRFDAVTHRIMEIIRCIFDCCNISSERGRGYFEHVPREHNSLRSCQYRNEPQKKRSCMDFQMYPGLSS